MFYEERGEFICGVNFIRIFECVNVREIYYIFFLIVFYVFLFIVIFVFYFVIVVILRCLKVFGDKEIVKFVKKS